MASQGQDVDKPLSCSMDNLDYILTARVGADEIDACLLAVPWFPAIKPISCYLPIIITINYSLKVEVQSCRSTYQDHDRIQFPWWRSRHLAKRAGGAPKPPTANRAPK